MNPDHSKEYYQSEDGFTFRYSSSEAGQPLLAIVNAVSWFNGVEPTDLEPLHNAINAEFFNDMFGESSDQFLRGSSESGPIDVRFNYEGCLVTVSDDEIHIEASSES